MTRYRGSVNVKRNQLWINTRVELQWNPLTQQYEEVSVEGYWADSNLVAYAHGTPSYDQDAYAWYNDGTESGSTIIGTANNSQTLDADTTYLIRFVIQETAGADGTNLTAQLEYDVNNSGTWNNVTSTSNNVRAVASTNLTDGNDTTQRLGAGTFISPNGGVDSGDGAAGGAALDITANNESEVLYAIQLRSADLANNDTIQLRVAGLNSYTNTAAATANVPNNVTVTVASDSLAITDGSVTVQADVDTNVTPSASALSITDGALTITTSTATEVTLSADSLTLTDGALTVQADVDTNVTVTADTLTITDGSLTITAQTNANVTLSPTALTITDGSVVVQADVDTNVTISADTLTISDGLLNVTASVNTDVTPSADSLTISNGSLTIQADVDTNITVSASSLSITDGTLSIITGGIEVTPTADGLTITNGRLVVWTGANLDSIIPDSGKSYYCQGAKWHLIDPVGNAKLFIQNVEPSYHGSYMWVQTNYNADGDFTIWLHDTTLDEVFP